MAKKKITLEEKLEEAIVKDVPYEVPGNWVWSRFGMLLAINPKKVDIKEIDDNIECSFIPMNIVDNKLGVIHETKIKMLGEVKKGYTNFVEGDVIFAKITPCMENRKSAIVPKLINNLGYGSTEFHVFRADDKYIDRKYIFYFVRSHEFISNATESMTGAVGQQRVPKSFIEEYELPLPPLKEQQRIVDKIESLFEKLDKAKELIEEARDGFEKRKAAILEKAFRGALTKEWRKNNKVTLSKELQDKKSYVDTYKYKMPESWRMLQLSDVADIIMGQSPKGDSYNSDGIGTPLINGPVEFGKTPFSNTIKSKWTTKPTKICEKNDLLLCVRGSTLGRINIAGFEACIGRGVAAIRAIIEQKYINYRIHSMREEIYNNGTGTTFPNISSKQIAEILIEVSPLEEQKEIVRILDNLLEDESKIEELTQLEDQIDLIKKSILAKAFRGELGTNCEDDESALELLKDILNN